MRKTNLSVNDQLLFFSLLKQHLYKKNAANKWGSSSQVHANICAVIKSCLLRFHRRGRSQGQNFNEANMLILSRLGRFLNAVSW